MRPETGDRFRSRGLAFSLRHYWQTGGVVGTDGGCVFPRSSPPTGALPYLGDDLFALLHPARVGMIEAFFLSKFLETVHGWAGNCMH